MFRNVLPEDAAELPDRLPDVNFRDISHITAGCHVIECRVPANANTLVALKSAHNVQNRTTAGWTALLNGQNGESEWCEWTTVGQK